MDKRFAHLGAVRCFAEAARLQSYTQAAETLHVTQAAVSQQIRHLETVLGVKLFARQGRHMVLTPAGERFYVYVEQAFQALQLGFDAISQEQDSGVLNISVLPSFAARWLMPRLWRFAHQYPHIEVRISTSGEVVDMREGSMDLGIRFGLGRYPGTQTELLMPDSLLIVCAPQIATKIECINDLYRFLLIDGLETKVQNWQTWLNYAGYELDLQRFQQNRMLKLENASMGLDIVLAGHGVCVCRRSLVEHLLSTGQLVQPFNEEMPLEQAYYLAYRADSPRIERIRTFTDWLHSEVGKLPFDLDACCQESAALAS